MPEMQLKMLCNKRLQAPNAPHTNKMNGHKRMRENQCTIDKGVNVIIIITIIMKN